MISARLLDACSAQRQLALVALVSVAGDQDQSLANGASTWDSTRVTRANNVLSAESAGAPQTFAAAIQQRRRRALIADRMRNLLTNARFRARHRRFART